MTFLSLLVGKVILKLLKLAGRTGSALPGYVVEKLDPGVLKRTLGRLPYGIVVISGTNGKTTTTKILSSLLEAQGLRVLTNKTGSNFVRGIVSTIVQYAHLSGRLDYDIAVFEQDEAYAAKLVEYVQPTGVIALNVMRDQMDRFGEIDATQALLQKLVGSASQWAVLNANDERIGALKPDQGVETHWYGHTKHLTQTFLSDDQLYDAAHATMYQAAEPDMELLSYGDGTVAVRGGSKTYTYQYQIGGSHNAINLTAALTALHAMLPKLDETKNQAAVAALEPAFGRGEVFTVDGNVEVTLQLVKNPAGFLHALRMLEVKPYSVVGIVINDEYADGRDVSWLWDVDFSSLKARTKLVATGGTRAADMALRLKYDEVPTAYIAETLASFVAETNHLGAEAKGRVIIYCTYTAMLELRDIYKQYSSEVYEVRV